MSSAALADQYVTIEYNATALSTVTIPWQNLTSTGLTNYSAIWFMAKLSYLDSDNAATNISKSLGAGIVVTTAGDNVSVNGVITITFAPGDTANHLPLTNSNLLLVFSCMGTDGLGNPWPLCRGKLTILPNASQAG